MTRSDIRNKEIALGRIKRLASSGLPLDPFIRALFELVDTATPHSPNRTFHIGSERTDAYICNSAELNRVIPLHNRFYVEASPEVSGARFRVNPAELHRRFPSKITWMHEEVTLPNLYLTEGFHTVFKPWGFHHCLMTVFHEPDEYLGCYPIWRSSDQPPFNSDDAKFIRVAAPSIAHGLKVSRLLARTSTNEVGAFEPLPGWGSGVLLVNSRGELIGVDAEASLLLRQLQVIDASVSPHGRDAVREILREIATSVTQIFSTEDDGFESRSAVSSVFSHWSGMVLKFRGIRIGGVDGSQYVTVLVERGETSSSRRKRFIYRWGLSHREAEVLALIVQGKTGPEIAILASISHDTVRKHTSRILEKLGVETRGAAASMARAAKAPQDR